MPLKVGSMIFFQYWPMLAVCAASSAEVRRSMCTTSVSSVRARAGDWLRWYRLYGKHRCKQRCASCSPVPVHPGPPQASGDEDDFTDRAGFQDFLVCSCRLRERQLLGDDGAERAIFQTGDERGVDFSDFPRRCSPYSECENGSATHHQIARSYGGIAAATDDDDAPLQSQHLEIAAEVYVCEHLEVHIHASPAPRFQDFFLISSLSVIERLMRAFAFHELQSLVCAGGPEHGQPHSSGNL